MWNEAGKFNHDSGNLQIEVPAYDTCGDFSGETDTKWSVILGFNAILYLVLSVCTALLVIGHFFPPLACIGCLGHAFGSCVMLACIIVTGIFRYSAKGKSCADSGPELFKDHGKQIQGLFISQSVLYIFNNTFVVFMLNSAIMTGSLQIPSILTKVN